MSQYILKWMVQRKADREQNKETQIRAENTKGRPRHLGNSYSVCQDSSFFSRGNKIPSKISGSPTSPHFHISVPTCSLIATCLPKSLIVTHWYRGNAVLSSQINAEVDVRELRSLALGSLSFLKWGRWANNTEPLVQSKGLYRRARKKRTTTFLNLQLLLKRWLNQ